MREFHEVANIFPFMSEKEFSDLKDDIREHGQREPIWLHQDGSIVDGRNRYLACVDLGIEPKFRTWDGKGSLVGFAVSLNLKRRHLDSSQASAIAVEILPLLEKEAKERQKEHGNTAPGVAKTLTQKVEEVLSDNERTATAQAAALTGTNRQYVADAKNLKENAPDLFAQVKAGKKKMHKAKREYKERKREECQPSPPIAPASPTLLVGDIDTLSMFDDNSIDIIITSPPYNLGDETWPMGGDGRQERDGIGYQSHNDNMSQAEYEAWQIHVFKELWRIAKPGASFFYNHKTRTENGRLIHPMRWVGDDRNPWLVRQEIIWNRLSTHNHSASLFWPIDERIYWMTKGPPSLTEPIGMSTIWEKFGPVPNTWHPAPFTVELPRMLLKAMNAGPGQIVLDPFVGSCSTMHAALERGCEAVGIDICEEYLERAVKESGWVWTTD